MSPRPLVALPAISGIDARGEDDRVAPAIKAVQEDEKTVRVIVPGNDVHEEERLRRCLV